MIHDSLINPKSIAIVGGSENTVKPGGKIIENLKKSGFKGELFVINPKANEIQGLDTFNSLAEAPTPDLVILAIPARFCPQSIEELCEKGTRAFIVISAGFGELNEEGKVLDQEILKILAKYDASLLGPNCIGLIHHNHHSVFTTPVPDIVPQGVEFISSSGSTAVFVVEAGMMIGIPFSNIYTVGNALQIKVEDILEYLDNSYDPDKSSRIKMIYIENIDDPQKFVRHSRSLISKGAKIVALKAGMTDAGNRAASSHTGAMASPTVAVDAMFRKAGVLQCFSRQELLYTAAVILAGIPEGKNIAIITHAGGAGVMLTDALEKSSVKVPEIKGPDAEELLENLYPGSSIANPIDFLATGTKEQLEKIIDFCDTRFDNIDAMAVIFGSPGLFDVTEIYEMLAFKMKTTKKPLYPILPSPVNNRIALETFVKGGNFFFPEETRFGEALSRVVNHETLIHRDTFNFEVDQDKIDQVISNGESGYLPPEEVMQLLKSVGIPVVQEKYANDEESLKQALIDIDFPLVMKVVGPVHKSDLGGVILDINTYDEATENMQMLMEIEGAESVLIQPMLSGLELFIGAKKEDKFGHLIMFGMGGIFLEVIKDVSTLMNPLTEKEVMKEIKKLRSYPLLKGIRGKKGIDINLFCNTILRLSKLVSNVPNIEELDLNPLLADENSISVVDARIRLK